MNAKYLIWGALVVAVYQLLVTFRLLHSVQYSQSQKIAQLLMIWGVPLLGAIVCELFLSSDRRTPKMGDIAFTPDEGVNPPGIGPDGGHH